MDVDAAPGVVATGSARAIEKMPRSLDKGTLCPQSTAWNAVSWFGSSRNWTASSHKISWLVQVGMTEINSFVLVP
ncbi:hypothetical protein R1flu_019419 [Riccia fluitans]|uniref:Uncharacterized protein n=1 Tax=Riccia fluitans TaxID=41844 RepID=A0ABD1ZKS9_9MARC